MDTVVVNQALMADLTNATKRAELVQNPWLFLEQYGINPHPRHTSQLMNRLPGFAEGQPGMRFTDIDSWRTTSSDGKRRDARWE